MGDIGTIVFEWRGGQTDIRHELSAEEGTVELVEACYWFLLGCGHDPKNVANAMIEVGEEHSPVPSDT